VASAAKEPAEEVEWIVVLGATALLPLLQTIIAVLVVDLSRLGVAESFVRFRDLDELVFRRRIASGKE
jgi:hypothetical protein